MATKMKLRPVMAAEEAVRAPTTDKEEQAAIGFALASAALHVIDTVMRSRGMTRKSLADRLGVTESTISRQLDDRANLTTRTLGKLFGAIGDVPQFTSKAYCKMVADGVAQDLREFVPAFTQPSVSTSKAQVAGIADLRPQVRGSEAPEITAIEA
jgi:transcriptional regulator with XRE-family HTH domain